MFKNAIIVSAILMFFLSANNSYAQEELTEDQAYFQDLLLRVFFCAKVENFAQEVFFYRQAEIGKNAVIKLINLEPVESFRNLKRGIAEDAYSYPILKKSQHNRIADHFKSEYFNSCVRNVEGIRDQTPEFIEFARREFWRAELEHQKSPEYQEEMRLKQEALSEDPMAGIALIFGTLQNNVNALIENDPFLRSAR